MKSVFKDKIYLIINRNVDIQFANMPLLSTQLGSPFLQESQILSRAKRQKALTNHHQHFS